ncbi:MAG: amino acid permease, partial [Acidobacteria bacterium]|nr:amino acid permease [Acidobacteriota bacterium]
MYCFSMVKIGAFAKSFFRTKKVEDIIKDSEDSQRSLKRVLGPFDLFMLGIGGIIGAGIFALIGTAAAGDSLRSGAGPALMVSIVLTSIACLFCGLCYAEFASTVPVSGSAYTYAYASLGELLAWIIGWDLLLEYAVGNIAVAVSWSGYFVEFLRTFSIYFPKYLAVDWVTAARHPEIAASAPRIFGFPLVFNLPAVFIVVFLTVILTLGIKISSRFNITMVFIKLSVLFFFIIIGMFFINPENYKPFAPNGFRGIQTGAAIIFFAFIGFDAVSTAAEETKNPKKDMPIGILGSLGFATLVYLLVTFVLTGMMPSKNLNTAEPLSVAMRVVNMNWAAGIVAFGSIVAHTAVLLVFQLGQPRIFFSMARDGLLPSSFAKVHPRFKTPYIATIAAGAFVALGAAISSLEEMADLCNIGTLAAFVIVCVSVLILRYKEPDRKVAFKTPLVPFIPILGVLFCFYLILGLPKLSYIRFGIWLFMGLVLY